MHAASSHVIGLTAEGCQSRQRRLAERLRKLGLPGALICDRRHVYYFSGYWAAFYHAPLLIITDDGEALAVLPDLSGESPIAADATSHYESHWQGTLVEDQFSAALRMIEPRLASIPGCGIDLPGVALKGRAEMQDISQEVLALRRAKQPDEVELIRQAVHACEAAYARIAEILHPGLREIDIYAEVQAAAVKALGEPIGELGNDFQSGTPGGPPRKRAIESGELMPLDVAVTVRGYRCDLCRTFVVGGQATSAQQEAFRRVGEAIEFVEHEARIGHSCRRLFDEVKRRLDGYNGWRFFHHLGHGTGLSPHEAPRLNPHWDEVFEAGDVFTVEPGLYHEELRGGVRLEQNYWLTKDGLTRLSSYPLGI
jgi:Xaa-Pro aminopeptidase